MDLEELVQKENQVLVVLMVLMVIKVKRVRQVHQELMHNYQLVQ